MHATQYNKYKGQQKHVCTQPSMLVRNGWSLGQGAGPGYACLEGGWGALGGGQFAGLGLGYGGFHPHLSHVRVHCLWVGSYLLALAL